MLVKRLNVWFRQYNNVQVTVKHTACAAMLREFSLQKGQMDVSSETCETELWLRKNGSQFDLPYDSGKGW